MQVPTCSFSDHFWPRKKRLYYVGWGSGNNFQRYRLRFCDPHAAVVEEYLSEFEVGSLDGTAGHSDLVVVECLACRQPIHEIGWQVFVTGYPAQDERKDYWGGLHADCQLPDYLLDPSLRTPQ